MRRHLKAHWPRLTALALADAAAERAAPDLPLLAAAGWIPAEPLDPARVRMTLRPARPEEDFGPMRERAAAYWPAGPGGSACTGYAAAIAAYDRPRTWFDAPIYRLLGVRAAPDRAPGAEPGLAPGLELDFSIARYFDAHDAGESLAYEAALRHLAGTAALFGGPVRAALGGPFALGARCGLPGISTLTLQVERGAAYFFMHRRSGSGVAVAPQSPHVTPAGEFQPHVDAPEVWRSDLDLWRNTVREYAEEFLGGQDAAVTLGAQVDYARDQPHARMAQALAAGGVRLRVLGVGVDPLSWKPEILTACVWDAAVFDEIFGGMPDRNDEGSLVFGRRRPDGALRGLPFTAQQVLGYAGDPATVPAARSCLGLAWRWRDQLGLPTRS